jgi:cell division protein FtsZ
MSFNSFGAKIKVIGVGGGGGNAVNTMIRSGLEGVDFIVANTDAQALKASLAPHKIQLGKDLTKGLGAGADPDIGRDAALEDRMELQDFLSDADMVFITAGMGGGTGTGAAAVVAQIARELGALTVAVVTKPFAFEGKRRRKHAEQGVARLRECVDTLITIPNQRLLQVATPDLSMLDAFKLADNVLVNAVRGISDIINTPGLINVDFADVKTVMSSMGHALMGIGYGAGSDRALLAAKQAISSPLLEDVDIEGATGILINITAGTNVSIMEVNNACMVIQEAAHEDANIIFGAVIDEALGDEIRITVIATGFPVEDTVQADEALMAQQQRYPGRPAAPAQRLIAPPRLTSSHMPPVNRERSHVVTPQPALNHPSTQQIAHQPHPSSAPVVRHAQPQAPVAPPVQTSHYAAPAEVAPAPAYQTPSAASAPIAPIASVTPPAIVESAVVDAALEASALAQWTMGGDDSVEHFDEASLDDASHLHALEIERSDAPGTPVFEEPVRESSSVADLVFESSVSADLARVGAVKASEPFSWGFDAPSADDVSHEIDRHIDEAMALAEKLNGPAESQETSSSTKHGSSQSLDLDDLDLPAFLRSGADSRRGGEY